MTMISLSSPATSGLHQTSPPWRHCIRFSGARFVSHAFLSPCHCLFEGSLQLRPGAVLPSKAPTGFFHAAPVFGPYFRVEYAIQPATGFEGRGSSMHTLLEVNVFGLCIEISDKAPARAAGRPPLRE